MLSIKDTFKDRIKWNNKRSSTIFPIYLNNNNDQVLVFQNYWKWKNKINKIKFILTLRNENSKIKSQIKIDINDHNEISIKKFFNIKKSFLGQLECELKSSENLKFPYPALLMFYKNNHGFLSSVHSAGRHIGENEKVSSKFYESNFHCLMNSEFCPVIHFFCGDILKEKYNFIELIFLDEKNCLIFKKKLLNFFLKPYSSKIIFLEKYLKKSEIKKIYNRVFFIKIKFEIPNIFGRLIVGNYDKKNDALFLTHTFRVFNSKKKNLINLNKKYNSTGFIPLMNSYPLRLIAKSYPTNASAVSKFSDYILKNNENNKIGTGLLKTGDNSKNIFKIENSESKYRIIEFKDSIPDRVNVELNYFLKNSRHPTDIADGIKTCYQPRKSSYWGHGVCKKNYKTFIIIGNYSNLKDEMVNDKISLTLFSNKKKIKKNIFLKKKSFRVLKFKDLKSKFGSDYFSWKVYSTKANLNIYWLSFNDEGSICGDHAF
jgi:hypothetical protein